MAFGASSGGAFAAYLPFFARVDGVVAQISGVGFPRDPRKPGAVFARPFDIHAAVARGEGVRGSARYPPVVFSHMPRDASTAAAAETSRAFLERAGVAARITSLHPQAIDGNFFHRRVVRAVDAEGDGEIGPGVTEPAIRVADSEALARSLRDDGFLDAGGFLKRDPRNGAWRERVGGVIQTLAVESGLAPDESPVGEALNVAFALHELSSDRFDEDMKWLEERLAERREAAEVVDQVPDAPREGGVGVFPAAHATVTTSARPSSGMETDERTPGKKPEAATRR
jgi:hypothetical protein